MGASFSVSRWPHYLQHELLSGLSAALLKALTRFSLAMAEAAPARRAAPPAPAAAERFESCRIVFPKHIGCGATALFPSPPSSFFWPSFRRRHARAACGGVPAS